MTAAFWVALLGSLPQLLGLLTAVANHAAEASEHGKGYDQAVQDGLVAAANGLKAAIAAENAARAEFARHPTDDSGFDPEFEEH